MTLTSPDGRAITNALEEAIWLALGGPLPACQQLEVTVQAVYKLLAGGYVSSRALALRLEGVTGIPAVELMQLAPWRPGDRNHDGPTNGTRRKRKPPSKAVPAPAVARAPVARQARAKESATLVGLRVRSASIVRPLSARSERSVPARLLAAWAALQETEIPPSAPGTRCSGESIPPISQGAAAAALVGNQKAYSKAVSPCSLRPKILIFRARRVHKRAFRVHVLVGSEAA
jgi:hypothetical protein